MTVLAAYVHYILTMTPKNEENGNTIDITRISSLVSLPVYNTYERLEMHRVSLRFHEEETCSNSVSPI